MLAGAAVTEDEADAASAGWAEIAAGPWLAETLQALRAPSAAGGDPGAALKGALRPYQQAGVAWLRLVCGLGLGACLADDMGLGKTIQVLALLLLAQRDRADAAARPSLLVAPASLLANWAGEIEKFAPEPQSRDRSSLGHEARGCASNFPKVVRRVSILSSRATDRCCGSHRSRTSPGVSSFSTRRRRSRTPAPSRPARRKL